MPDSILDVELSKELVAIALNYFKKRRRQTSEERIQARRILVHLSHLIRDLKRAVFAYDQLTSLQKPSGFVDISGDYSSFESCTEAKENVLKYLSKLKSFNTILVESGFYSRTQKNRETVALLFEDVRSIVAHSRVYLKKPSNETMTLFSYEVEQAENMLDLIGNKYGLGRIV